MAGDWGDSDDEDPAPDDIEPDDADEGVDDNLYGDDPDEGKEPTSKDGTGETGSAQRDDVKADEGADNSNVFGNIEDSAPDESSKFGIVPTSILKDTRLTGGDIRVYAALASFADKRGRAFPSVRQIAERMGGKDLRNVRRHLAQLKKAGLIKILEPGGHIDGERWANLFYLPANDHPWGW